MSLLAQTSILLPKYNTCRTCEYADSRPHNSKSPSTSSSKKTSDVQQTPRQKRAASASVTFSPVDPFQRHTQEHPSRFTTWQSLGPEQSGTIDVTRVTTGKSLGVLRCYCTLSYGWRVACLQRDSTYMHMSCNAGTGTRSSA